MTPAIRERLYGRCVRDEETGCLTWQGPLRKGYGRISWHNVSWRVHRVAWTVERGPIPEGLTIDHLCRNTACLNVEHMEIVTGSENVARSWLFSPRGRAQTECIRGHALAGDNLLLYTVSKNGRQRRSCRTCRAIRRAKSKAARLAA